MTTTGAWVAAHSADTARAGIEILEAGGDAADAAAAMTLAACVAEPLVVSLLSGMHAIHVSSTGQVRGVDGFVDVPTRLTGGRTAETAIVFADEQVPYTIGGATFGVPGLVAGCAALNRDHGRLPWPALVEPARRLARSGVKMSAKDESLLAMLQPVMRLGVGTEVFVRPDGTLKGEDDPVHLPGIDGVLDQLAQEGPTTLYTGPLGQDLAAFCAEVGSLVNAADLAAMTPLRHTPPAVRMGRWRIRTRRGLSPLSDWLGHLASRPAHETTVQRLAAVQEPWVQQVTGTTSLCVVDAQGNACAVTASLGLGTGDWFRGSQLNSMLGEADLQRGPLRPRTRMGSMMAPTAILDDGQVLAVMGAAGGSRIPSSVMRVLYGVTVEGLDSREAVDLPRLHRIGQIVHVEPHMPDAHVDQLEQAGWQVRRWQTRHHFFGGVSVAGRHSAEGDPRRGGAAFGVSELGSSLGS